MEENLPFLARLGLGADADSSAIRRSYARELKLLDLATQAQQFQHLREAYEAALEWVGRSADATVFTPAVVGDGDDSGAQQAASLVYEEFLAACAPLRQKDRLRDQSGWIEVLLRHQADARLFSLPASLNFEIMMAADLAKGWMPGNDMLFQIAANVFEWESDASRVQQLGAAAGMIREALEQRFLFESQEEASYRKSRNVLAGLRLSEPPLAMRLKLEMPHLEAMLQYFPSLISVTAGMDNVARWRALYGGLRPPATAERVASITFAQHRSVSQRFAVVKELSVPVTIIVLVIALARFASLLDLF